MSSNFVEQPKAFIARGEIMAITGEGMVDVEVSGFVIGCVAADFKKVHAGWERDIEKVGEEAFDIL